MKTKRLVTLLLAACMTGALFLAGCAQTGDDNKADLAVSIDNCANDEIIVRYSGSPYAVSYTASGNVTLTVTYEGISGTEYAAAETAPADAGTYSVALTYAGDDTYKAYSDTVTLTILQADGSLKIVMNDVVYGTAVSPEVTENTAGSAVTYSYEGIEGTDYAASATAPSALGKYRVTATAAGTRNYREATASAEFSIVKAKGETPDKPVFVSATDTTITVQAVSGLEYSVDKTVWESDGVLEGLSPMRTYNIYARAAETENFGASDPSEPLEAATLMPDAIKTALESKVTVAETFGDGEDMTLAPQSWDTNDDQVVLSADAESITASQQHSIMLNAVDDNLDWVQSGRKMYLLVDAYAAGYLWIYFPTAGNNAYNNVIEDGKLTKYFAEPQIVPGLALIEVTIPASVNSWYEGGADDPVTGLAFRTNSASVSFTLHGIYRDDIVYREELPDAIKTEVAESNLLTRDFSSGALTLAEDGGWMTNGSYVSLEDGVITRQENPDNTFVSLKANNNALSGVTSGGRMRLVVKGVDLTGEQDLYIRLAAGENYTYDAVINHWECWKYSFEVKVSDGWQVIDLDIGNIFEHYTGATTDPVTCVFLQPANGNWAFVLDSVYYDAPESSDEIPPEILAQLSDKTLISGDFSQGNLTLTPNAGWETNDGNIVINGDGTISHGANSNISFTIAEGVSSYFKTGNKIYIVLRSEESANKNLYIAVTGGANNTYDTVVNGDGYTNRLSFIETRFVPGWQIVEVNLTAYGQYAGDPDAVPTCLFIWGENSKYTIHSIYYEEPEQIPEIPDTIPQEIVDQLSDKTLISGDFSQGNLTLTPNAGWETNDGNIVINGDGTISHGANSNISFTIAEGVSSYFKTGNKIYIVLRSEESANKNLYIAVTGGANNTYDTVVNGDGYTNRLSFIETRFVPGWQIVEVNLTAYGQYAGDPDAVPTCLFIWGENSKYTIHSIYYEEPEQIPEIPDTIPQEIVDQLSDKTLISGDFSQGNLTLTENGGWNTNNGNIAINDDGTIGHANSDACISLTIAESASSGFESGNTIYIVLKSENTESKDLYISVSGGANNTYETVINADYNRISFMTVKYVPGWQILAVDITAYGSYTGDPEAVPACLFIWGSGAATYTIHSVYAE